MKKRVPGFRVFAVKTVLMLAALSVSTLTLRASKEMDALSEVLVKHDVPSEGSVIVIKSGVTSMVAEESAHVAGTETGCRLAGGSSTSTGLESQERDASEIDRAHACLFQESDKTPGSASCSTVSRHSLTER